MKTGIRITLSVLSVVLFIPPVLAQWTNVGTGIDYQQFSITMTDNVPNNVFVTRMAVSNTNCIIGSMIASNQVSGATETVSAQASRNQDVVNYWGQAWGQRNNVVAAVNGSFFSGVITGGDIYDGWYAKRFDDFSGEMGFVWKMDRSYFIGVCPHYVANQQTVTVGAGTLSFDGINVARGANQLVLYTPQYNNNTLTDGTGVEVLVQLSTPLMILTPPSSTVNGTIEAVRVSQGATPIPFDHLVLSGVGTAATFLQTYAQVGQSVAISQNLQLYDGPPANLCSTTDNRSFNQPYALAQGNFQFLKSGAIQPTSNSGMIIRNPRTFVAYNASYVYFAVCDGRSAQSVGMTSDEMGAFCTNTAYLGATYGVNQDGGGSSTMVVNGVVMNTPSDGSPRAVANGLMMVNLAPKLLSTTFNAGQAVSATARANVRLGPGTNYYAFASVASGAQGTVVNHAISGTYATGSYWWKCNFSGTTGWIAESLLVGAAFIAQQPTNQTVVAAQSASFTVVASGASQLSYQWQKNTVDLNNGGHYSGCTTNTLRITNADSTDVASYRCVVINVYGSVTSSPATLAVTANGIPPNITQQPTNQSVATGAMASFAILASGSGPLSYQWQKNQVNMADGGHYGGCATAVLAVNGADSTDAASYRCVVTNAYGSVTSSVAALTLLTSSFASGALVAVPTLSGDATNEARAITSDGLWVAGVSGTRGFLYDVVGGHVYNVLDPFGAQSTVAAGVCYRTSGGQQQVIVGGMAAGWNADYCFTNGTAFAQVRRDNTYGSSGQSPAIGIANLRAWGGGDVVWGGWGDVGTSWEFLAVGKVSGVWQGPSTTVATDKTASLGTTSFGVYGVSGTGRAVGFKGSSKAHYVVDWVGTGTPKTWSFNGLNGTTAGAAYSVSTNGTVIFGQSPVSGGRPGSWGYKAVVSSASPGVLQSISELPSFPETVGTAGSASLPYGCMGDGKYAVGMSYRGIEKAVLWDTRDASAANWTVTDLTDLALAKGSLGIFSRLARAYSVGTNSAGSLVIAGMGLDTNSPANARAFLMTVWPMVPRPTVNISGSYAAGFTFSFLTVTNASLAYYLDYTTNLSAPIGWTAIGSTPGSGTVANLFDLNPSGAQRFYCIRVQ